MSKNSTSWYVGGLGRGRGATHDRSSLCGIAGQMWKTFLRNFCQNLWNFACSRNGIKHFRFDPNNKCSPLSIKDVTGILLLGVSFMSLKNMLVDILLATVFLYIRWYSPYPSSVKPLGWVLSYKQLAKLGRSDHMEVLAIKYLMHSVQITLGKPCSLNLKRPQCNMIFALS